MYHKKHMKRYAQILMLGRNCEPAYYFFRQFGFIDSNLFAWAYVKEEQMISVLNAPSVLLSGKLLPVAGRGGIMQHIPTGFLFHGRSSDYTTASRDTIQRDIEELQSRLKYLITKFEASLHSSQKKLFILTLESNIHAKEYLASLYEAIKSRTQNFDLLCIVEEKAQTRQLMSMQDGTLFIRCIDHFAPGDRVTNLKSGDPEGWKKIFSEFGPATLKKSTRRFKFESRD